ncbi:MAG: bile acid:sodium symporter family protein [Bacteroidota bacterium]
MYFSTYTYIDLLISLVLSLIMIGLGLSLTPVSFRNVLISPKSLIIGLLIQMLGLPIIAFLITLIFKLPWDISVGLIILAACPGGTTASIITYFFKGNVALAITFSSINSLLTLVSIPFIVNLSLRYFAGHEAVIRLPYFETIIQIFVVTILPAAIGVFIRTFNPAFAAKLQRPLNIILLAALAVVFIIKFFAGENQGGSGITIQESLQILPSALLLNAVCFLVGYKIGLKSKLGYSNSYTIAIEAAVHNTTLAFLVAGTLLQNQDMVKPSLIYAMFSFWTAIIFSIAAKKYSGVKPLAEFIEG